MNRYFFHIRSGNVVVPDDEGMYLFGMEAARAEALLRCGDLPKEGIHAGAGLGCG